MAGDQGTGGAPDFAVLPAGHRFEPATFTADEAAVAAYLEAVDDTQFHHGTDGPQGGGRLLVPPVAVAALALRRLAGDLALQPGSVHLGQEYEFGQPVQVGEELVTHSQIVNRSRRRGMVILIIEQDVRRGEATVLIGRSTLGVPEAAQQQSGGA